MLRQLINVVLYGLQTVRKYIKPLILIVSFLTFIWLIVDTTHRPEFVRHASKHSFRRNQTSDPEADRWDQLSVQRFLDLLEIDVNVSAPDRPQQGHPTSCQQDNTLLFTAFAGSTFVEHMWHYLSLIALQRSVMHAGAEQFDVRTMLTVSARAELSQLFVSLSDDVIDQQKIQCYDVSTAYILNDDNTVEVPEAGSQLYILNNNARRLREILQVSWEDLAMYFQIDLNSRKIANDILVNLRQRTIQNEGEEVGASLQFVGLKVDDGDELPFEYYYRAITFQRKMYDNGQLLFVLLCKDTKGAICSMLNAQSEHITVLQQNIDPTIDFALMALCNHTIVSQEADIFPPLLRGTGYTVVYGYENEYSTNLGHELANYKDHWYSIV